MTDPCTARISSFFLVTVMSSDGVIITTVQHQHPVATIHIVLPRNMDKCNLIVNISVGNSAGMSSPTEITVGRLITIFPGATAAVNYFNFVPKLLHMNCVCISKLSLFILNTIELGIYWGI